MENKRLMIRIIRLVLLLLVISFFFWIYLRGHFKPIYEETEKFKVLVQQHLELVLVASLLAIFTAIPAGILVTREGYRKAQGLVLNLANLGIAVPGIALLALLIGFVGVGFFPAVIVLYISSVLFILRNTIAGVDSVASDVIDAAKGMGLKSSQILWRVELPNAAYSIMAGIRTAVVFNIGTAALAFMIGAGGLGVWIMTGIRVFDTAHLLSGAVPVTLLALLADYLLRLSEKVIVPKPVREAIKNKY